MNKSIILLLIALMTATIVSAQAGKKTEEIRIQTSGQCEMCKTRIETALAYEKGVVRSDLNLENKVLTVQYKTNKTTPDSIRKAVAALGYDADDVVADEKAYNNLPSCCKKPDDPAHIGH